MSWTRSALAAAVLALCGAPAAAELRCDAPGNLLRWPQEQPVWELCWLRAIDSSGPAGSGLELRDVHFRGLRVLERAQVPVVWSEMTGGGPGCERCFRTWTSEESPFGVRGEVVPGYYEVDLSAPGSAAAVRTICDRPAGAAPGECPWGEAAACGQGVVIERWDDGFRLTTQLAAGWFVYSQRWTFHRDGTIEPRFGFARRRAVCSASASVDSAVWRLDLDVGGPANRFARSAGADGVELLEVSGMRGDTGFRLTAGPEDLDPRWLVTAYDAGTLTDPGTSCAFDPDGLEQIEPPPLESEQPAADPDDPDAEPEPVELPDAVVWYIASAADVAAAGCREVGPTLTPFGPWRPPPGPRIFADGFESGGLGEWISSDDVVKTGEPD